MVCNIWYWVYWYFCWCEMPVFSCYIDTGGENEGGDTDNP